MARVELAPEVFDDFDRIVEHLAGFAGTDAGGRIGEIVAAFDVLAQSPRIGRPVAGGLRELVIGRAGRGYVALYRYVAAVDVVFVLAVRGGPEEGFRRED